MDRLKFFRFLYGEYKKSLDRNILTFFDRIIFSLKKITNK